ncbi:MAG: DUF4410 domain-containing protein [bacterium]
MKLLKIIIIFTIFSAFITSLFINGCVSSHIPIEETNYAITTTMKKPIDSLAVCSMGIIVDKYSLYDEKSDKQKKSENDYIQSIRNYLVREIEKKELFDTVIFDAPEAKYIIKGEILGLKKGNEFLQATLGSLAGDAILEMRLFLIDKQTGYVLFSGVFKGIVQGHWGANERTYERIANSFAKELKNNNDFLCEFNEFLKKQKEESPTH